MSVICPNDHTSTEDYSADTIDALWFVRRMNNTAHDLGYFLAPFGSSIIKGYEGRDLDIVAVPRYGAATCDHKGLIQAICDIGYEVKRQAYLGNACEVLLRPKFFWRPFRPVIDLHIREIHDVNQ